MDEAEYNMDTKEYLIREGLQPWSKEPLGNTCFEAAGPKAQVLAQKNSLPDGNWTLHVNYLSGRREEIPFCTEGSLQQWIKLSPELRKLVLEVCCQIAGYEAMYGQIGLALLCCMNIQALVDDPADRAVLLLEMGRLMERTSSWEKSLRYYSQVVGLEPMDDTIWKSAMRGMYRGHYALGNIELADHFLDRANVPSPYTMPSEKWHYND